MKLTLVALAILAAGCSASAPTSKEQEQERIVLENPLPFSQPYAIQADQAARFKGDYGVYEDRFLHIQDWREAVLDHADRTTLLFLADSSREKVRALEKRDAELATRPPAVVYDARLALFEQIALEREKLKLIRAAIAEAASSADH